MTRTLAVDLGGTHVRFRCTGDDARPGPVHVVRADEATSFEAAFGLWRERTGTYGRLDAIAVAAAGPIVGDRVRITNLGWTLDARALERSIGVGRCLLVNDVTAVAWALPSLGSGDVRTLGVGDADARIVEGGHGPRMGGSGMGGSDRATAAEPREPGTGAANGGIANDGREPGTEARPGHAARAVIAPGTGLGVSGLVPAGTGDFAVIEGEGGHRTLAAQNPREWAIVTALAERFGHASAERALSGPGIEAIRRAIASIDGLPGGEDRSAAEIARAAFASTDPVAEEAIATFTGFLGSVAGDLALTLGARGGVYLAGGIVPGWGERFDAAHFLDRFRAKGRFRGWLGAVPVYVVTHPYPALAGAERLLTDRDTSDAARSERWRVTAEAGWP